MKKIGNTIIILSILLIESFSLIAHNDSLYCALRDDEARYREHNFDFEKLVLNLSFNPSEKIVYGIAEYLTKPIVPYTDTLFLNAPGISVSEVYLNEKSQKFDSIKEGIIIRFENSLNWNQNYSLKIKYQAHPSKGLYFIGWNVNKDGLKYDENHIRNQIWSQGQGIDNRHWIPCYDDVNDKLITELKITFDSSYTVVSNGKLVDLKVNENKTKTWHYAMKQPHVPYLIMIGIDKFSYKDIPSKSGITSRQYYYPERPNTFEPTYQYSAEMMDWMPTETGVPYPWEVYANVPVQEFMYGAMENTTATIFTDYYVMDSRQALERNYIGTNAHELTHQWFGDLITEWSATHHWLHESFATYYSKLFIKHIKGKDEYDWIRRGEANSAISADRNDNFPVAHSKGGSARHYPKGSFIIDMLRNTVGDSIFKKTIKNYLTKHSFGNVDTHDFWRSFMETAGINLDWFFEQWIYKSGIPSISVEMIENEIYNMFIINQNQEVNIVNGIFRIPVEIQLNYIDGSQNSVSVVLNHQIDTIFIKKESSKILSHWIFDPDFKVLKISNCKKNYKMWLLQAQNASHILDRHEALIEISKIESFSKKDDLIDLFKKEKFWALKEEILKQLGKEKHEKDVLNVFKIAITDKHQTVRKAAIEQINQIPIYLVKDYESLLGDSSYVVIETVFRKLCKDFPEKTELYCEKIKNVNGINKNVKLAKLELDYKKNRNENVFDELCHFTGPLYEFRTRNNAFECIERTGILNEILCINLLEAIHSPNGKLSRPAFKCLKSLINKSTNNLQIVSDLVNSNKIKADFIKTLNKLRD